MNAARAASVSEASFSGRCQGLRAAFAPALQRYRHGRSPSSLRAHALLDQLAHADLAAAVQTAQYTIPQLQSLSHSLSWEHLESLVGSAPQAQLQHLLTLADATAAALGEGGAAATAAAEEGAQGDAGWFQPLVEVLEFVLGSIKSGLDKVNCPYSYGYSIILLTLLVKAITFPLTKQQVESALAVQQLKPELDLIKAKYGENKEAIQREQSALYEKAGVNPLAGCLPTLATIPIFIGLYRSLSDSASSGVFDNEGFYFIPSLAGPTTIAAQKAGLGISWLWPFVDGAPPGGWEVAGPYLVLPLLVVVSQWVSSAVIAPPMSPDDPNVNTQKAIMYLLPLMVGWFSLNLPSGMALYYVSNTVFTLAIQIWLRKLGGANILVGDLGPIALGKARRTGTVAGSVDGEEAAAAAGANADGTAASAGGAGEGAAAPALAFQGVDSGMEAGMEAGIAAAPAVPTINRRCKRKRRELLEASAGQVMS